VEINAQLKGWPGLGIPSGLRRRFALGQKQIVRARGQHLADPYKGRQVRLALSRRIVSVSTLAQPRAPGNLSIREPKLSRPLPYPLSKKYIAFRIQQIPPVDAQRRASSKS